MEKDNTNKRVNKKSNVKNNNVKKNIKDKKTKKNNLKENNIKSQTTLGSKASKTGRGSRIRTHTGGFGDRCATIDTIPLNSSYSEQL